MKKKYHRNLSIEKSWQNVNPTSITSNERKVYVANLEKITGHDLLYKHLARIGVKPFPIRMTFKA